MCLKIHPPWSMPTETERIGQTLLKANDPYRLIGDQLFEQLHEEDYADAYSAEGKPGISPVILAFVSVFQYLEKLADRQAVVALRTRLDWKYALHLPLEYEGFDFSVVSEFWDRLITGQAEGRVYEKLVEQIRALGLIKEHGKQRTDSIAMLTKVRRLFRMLMRRGVYVNQNEEQAEACPERSRRGRKKRTHFREASQLKTIPNPVWKNVPKLTVLEKYKQLGQALDVLYRAPGYPAEKRRITPLLIEQRGEHTYVIAHCQTRRAQRTFRLDRMEIPGTY